MKRYNRLGFEDSTGIFVKFDDYHYHNHVDNILEEKNEEIKLLEQEDQRKKMHLEHKDQLLSKQRVMIEELEFELGEERKRVGIIKTKMRKVISILRNDTTHEE